MGRWDEAALRRFAKELEVRRGLLLELEKVLRVAWEPNGTIVASDLLDLLHITLSELQKLEGNTTRPLDVAVVDFLLGPIAKELLQLALQPRNTISTLRIPKVVATLNPAFQQHIEHLSHASTFTGDRVKDLTDDLSAAPIPKDDLGQFYVRTVLREGDPECNDGCP